MEETALVGLPAVSPAESPSAANKRKRKNPSPGKIETEEDLGQDEMEQDDNDSGHMGFEDDDDDEDDLSDSGEYDDKEDEENDLDDQIEDEEHQEMEHKEPHNPHIPNTAHIQHINLTGHTPTEGMPHPVAMVAVTQPNLVIPVKVGTLPSPQGTAQPPIRMTLSTQIQHPLTTATNQFIIKRGPGRPPGPGRPRGRPKGSVNSPVSFGERKSPGPGRPRIHPPKENQQKRPRGRPRIHPPKEPGEKKPRGRPISNPKYLAIVQTNGELQKRIKELESELGVMDDENAKLRKQLMELGVDTGSITRPPANLSFSPKDFKLRVVLHHPSPTKRSPCTTEEGETVEKKRPGRPRIHPLPDQNTPKKKRGRPRIHPITPKIPKKRGRPPKSSYIPKSECDTESVATTPVKVMDSAEEKELPNVIIKEGHYNGSPNSPPKPLTPLTPTQNGNNQTNGTPQVEYQQ